MLSSSKKLCALIQSADLRRLLGRSCIADVPDFEGLTSTLERCRGALEGSVQLCRFDGPARTSRSGCSPEAALRGEGS